MKSRGDTIPNSFQSRALILAPLGRDAALAGSLLTQAGLAWEICPSFTSFQQSVGDSVCFGILAEEAVRSADLRALSGWVNSQPTWSDLPFIILTHRRDGAQHHPETPRLSELLGNVTFLERPFHPLTFLSVARTAAKGRFRQYEARARIQELAESKQHLEERVIERTAELNQAHQIVLAEMTQRQEAEDRLRQSQKMEMIGQLTGGVAHDFNNLLMAVIGNLDLIRKRIPDDAKLERLIDGAMQGAQRGAALTQRLLAFARRQDLKVEPTDITGLLRGMNDLIERSMGRHVELTVKVPEKLPSVLVDPIQVELAILNLVVNARDAMSGGGQLTIEASEATMTPDNGDRAPASYVRVTVSDTGCGMDEETLQKATEPFFSTKELGKGTGLGLSMIHGLARQLDGALRLSSEVGVGTRAELWLPTTTKPAAEQTADSHSELDVAPSSSCTVLVVDDDPLISMSTALMVEDLGHHVVEVNQPSQALDVLRNGQKIDLLITDFSMPKMNGAELAEAARQLRPGLPVLLATGYADLPPGTSAELHRIGKPYQQEQLAAAIAAVMARSECVRA
jgi:signal transduction histidine kinase/CheY-like chemotaxis protein